MNQQLEDWYRQADAVKELYPSFNFKREAANRDFLACCAPACGAESL